MAIIEACINAFEHSGAEAGNVKLRYVIGQDRLEVFITDEGKGLKTQDSPGVVSDARRERGWGLKIIKELVDDVDIVTGDGGTTVRMVKYLDRSPREKASPEGGETGIGEKERNEGGNGSEET
jgi:serine/threonine-protein kinase RsbW